MYGVGLGWHFPYISHTFSIKTNNLTIPFILIIFLVALLIKGIVSPDWKGLQMVSLDRFEV
jgi:hypothetical protein